MIAAGATRPALPLDGYRPLYQAGCRCPSCAGTSWHVGRRSAECAHCGTPLPFAAEARPQ